MKKISVLLIALISLCSYRTFAQQKTGTICFIRANGYVGSMVNDKVYIDDSLVCKLKNKQYSLHAVPAGAHTVAVNPGGLSTQKRSTPLTITVEAGKTTYIDIAWADKVSCQELTANSATLKMQKLKQNNKCLSDK